MKHHNKSGLVIDTILPQHARVWLADRRFDCTCQSCGDTVGMRLYVFSEADNTGILHTICGVCGRVVTSRPVTAHSGIDYE